MRVANTVELKNKTNEILREVKNGKQVIITLTGENLLPP
jgi:prevent-host-death family protein